MVTSLISNYYKTAVVTGDTSAMWKIFVLRLDLNTHVKYTVSISMAVPNADPEKVKQLLCIPSHIPLSSCTADGYGEMLDYWGDALPPRLEAALRRVLALDLVLIDLQSLEIN